MEIIVIKTTANNKETANTVAEKIINLKLAACVQISEIASYYTWKSNVVNEKEYQISIKTISHNFEKIANVIKQNINYDIPQIIAESVKYVDKSYEKWVLDNCVC
ncbi:divalent-cation tolerance protein CutA [Candidatus Deianiraea vastatrix]|uniref:Divalent-cation tolerance protein CutA n=1 Tax=Candidatus Deianiraea vastatrix TaxID=2163644 RepID=A0A5B8XE38_9RICK|nr:divalent-cation tolerance protein CutA [Candidatus Deianiraea vastatrix]QED23609.1 Divalent-cation tolerance protein CutA [Candidatus Deianiraea vastatrix]